jgi:hypothetical protein
MDAFFDAFIHVLIGGVLIAIAIDLFDFWRKK